MKSNIILSVLLQVFILWTATSQTTWLPDSSQVTFYIKNAGFRVEGSFEGLEADIRFDPSHLEDASISASITAATIDTGIKLRDKHLRKSDYFDVERYPMITMSSRAFRKKGNEYEADFLLSLKGVEREVIMPFSFQNERKKGQFEGTLRIDRRDYEVGGRSLMLSDDVEIQIWVQVIRGDVERN